MKWSRIGKWLANAGLGLSLATGIVALAAPQDKPQVRLVPTNRREFGIPFNIDPREQARYKKIQLLASSDFGSHWEIIDETLPNRPSFRFKGPKDGEYWFAVRTVDTKNRVSPPANEDVVPAMKVMIDTVPPVVHLEALPRRGSAVSVRWEAFDDRIDLTRLVLEYQLPDSSDWTQVKIRKPQSKGSESFDAGTSEPIRVRLSVADQADNVRSASVNVPDGKPRGRTPNPAPDLSDNDAPPPKSRFASAEIPQPVADASEALPEPGEAGPTRQAQRPDRPADVGTMNPFAASEQPTTRSSAKAAGVAPNEAPEPSSPPILVNNPKFGLKYEVEDAGPNGPAAVELYITNDGGRNWFRHSEDPDRASPFPVDLKGEGTFGIKLVCKSSANQGDQPPTAGEVPQTIVEVDSTPPVVKLEPVKIVGNKAILTWIANDPHPAARPVMISVKPDTPDGQWSPIVPAPIENTGQFTWKIPANCPPKIHFRVDVIDAMNNRGVADTTESGAILVDRTKPRGRITGLDSGLRDDTSTNAKPPR